MKLIRKVTLAKWRCANWASAQTIPADAISIDLRTSGNTLSFWKHEADSDLLDSDALLALLGTQDRIDTIDVVSVPVNHFEGISFQPTPGNTCFTGLENLHVDLINLNHSTLSQAAGILGDAIYSSKTQRITRQSFKERLLKAIEQGKIELAAMKQGLRDGLGLKVE